MPWSRLSSAEDIPRGVSVEWVRWIRSPRYLLDDRTLPLDAMMSAYPNVERRHVASSDIGLDTIGHFGFFRPEAKPLWNDVVDWFDSH